MNEARILVGDVRVRLAELADGSVQTCVTSPPYFGLRDYGHGDQIGLEATPAAYVAEMVALFREVWRVLADDGTLWLNLGDSYNGSGGSGERSAKQVTSPGAFHGGDTKRVAGLGPKQLLGIPWRVAFALQDDGWYLRQDIIWAKPNPMPESVRDRCTKSHEYLFLLSKKPRYYFDSSAMTEPATDTGRVNGRDGRDEPAAARPPGSNPRTLKRLDYTTTGRNKRDVWTISTQAFRGAHFAVMPEALVEPCVLAGSREGDLVLDPFAGSGTVGVVALRHQRNFVGVELNAEYAEMAERRIRDDSPMLNDVSLVDRLVEGEKE